jgi:hypothetical protein
LHEGQEGAAHKMTEDIKEYIREVKMKDKLKKPRKAC